MLLNTRDSVRVPHPSQEGFSTPLRIRGRSSVRGGENRFRPLLGRITVSRETPPVDEKKSFYRFGIKQEDAIYW